MNKVSHFLKNTPLMVLDGYPPRPRREFRDPICIFRTAGKLVGLICWSDLTRHVNCPLIQNLSPRNLSGFNWRSELDREIPRPASHDPPSLEPWTTRARAHRCYSCNFQRQKWHWRYLRRCNRQIFQSRIQRQRPRSGLRCDVVHSDACPGIKVILTKG